MADGPYYLCWDGESPTGFVAFVTSKASHFVELEVDEIVSILPGEEGPGLRLPEHREHYLGCMIKWDSCSHFHFGEIEGDRRNAYLHLCGADAYQRHCRLLKELYALAFRLMGREPEPGEAWT